MSNILTPEQRQRLIKRICLAPEISNADIDAINAAFDAQEAATPAAAAAVEAGVTRLTERLKTEMARIDAESTDLHQTRREEDIDRCRALNSQRYAYLNVLTWIACAAHLPASPAAEAVEPQP